METNPIEGRVHEQSDSGPSSNGVLQICSRGEMTGLGRESQIVRGTAMIMKATKHKKIVNSCQELLTPESILSSQ